MPPNLKFTSDDGIYSAALAEQHDHKILRCAVLGCGMMGQEHCSYIAGYPNQLRVDFLCDPYQPSLDKCRQILHDFEIKQRAHQDDPHQPILLSHEKDLLQHVREIDLLLIATPNYLHTDSIVQWGIYEHLVILVEKPVAVNHHQLALLRQQQFHARIWVAMEYRFIPAIAKLLQLIPTVVGDIKMVTIRENRYPFLDKIGTWNRDISKTGDSLVEKCCHFFDLMRLITGQEANLTQVRAMAHRGVNYQDEKLIFGNTPILDAAYVTLPFQCITPTPYSTSTTQKKQVLACLELCMFAEGSRHQEEIIVTGSCGRLEAYLPENKVYAYQRPTRAQWTDRSVPPPSHCTGEVIYDCSSVRDVFEITDDELPTHGGYHYSSTAVEWYQLLRALRRSPEEKWQPLVSIEDGIRAVEIGLQATAAIVNETLPPNNDYGLMERAHSTDTQKFNPVKAMI